MVQPIIKPAMSPSKLEHLIAQSRRRNVPSRPRFWTCYEEKTQQVYSCFPVALADRRTNRKRKRTKVSLEHANLLQSIE